MISWAERHLNWAFVLAFVLAPIAASIASVIPLLLGVPGEFLGRWVVGPVWFN